MSKKIIVLLSTIMVIMLVITGCSTETGCVEAGGRTICAGENTELIQGTGGVWEIPDKYRFECIGVFYNDVDFEAIQPLKNPDTGVVQFQPEANIIVAYKVSNLGYELTDNDKEQGGVQKSSYYSTLRINDGEKIIIRPYPWDDTDYKYAKVNLDYRIPAVEIGESVETYDEFVTDTTLDFENDVLVFTTFFNDGKDVYNGVFEMKLQALSKYMESVKK